MQLIHHNEGAEKPLLIPVLVLPNTHAKVVDANITANAKLDVPWLYASEPHNKIAVICGGGPSLADSMHDIRWHWEKGHTIFGLNGAANFLANRWLAPDYQIIIDAQEITSSLVEADALHRVYASHVHPQTAQYADQFFHLNFDGLEDLLPPEKVAAGGYTLVGGGVSVGITALVVAYVMGYREFHLFGYDSSNRPGKTHAYSQPHNAMIPNIDVEWGGQTYNASMPMKLQAEAFLRFAWQLQDAGCTLHVHGDGLLPAMWRVEPMTEREKYQKLWAMGDYGDVSPGEFAVEEFCDLVWNDDDADAAVIDFGCGTGRAALALSEAGFDVRLTDFTDNCREKACLHLPFVQWDLTKPGIPLVGDIGFCCDVMEHIPTEDVDTVLANIFAVTPRCYFQISTVPDMHGATIGQRLHMTVRDHEWWAAKFNVLWSKQTPINSCFYATERSD
jgi:uncharacterized Rossmann fold enzyme/SAM-dependent methyltransferase